MHDAIREEAAAWFAKRHDGRCARDEEAAFEAWCRRSEAHARAYAATERAWHEWGQLQSSERLREMATGALVATTRHRQRATASWTWRSLLTAACIVAVVVTGGVELLPRLLSVSPVTYRTSLGEQRIERLTDGTRITLNTETALEVRYAHGRRHAVLQHGEAMFEVVHDAKRPFALTAGDGSVTDLGTRFDVRDDSGSVIVTLLRGKVEIATQDAREQLTPGEQARYGVGVAGIRVRRADLTAVTAWLRGRLDLNGTLAEAIAEANRYSTVKLRLGDPSLADLQVGGSFYAGDNADIAAALSAVFPVCMVRRGAHEIVLMPRGTCRTSFRQR